MPQEYGIKGGVEPIAIIGMGCRWPGDCETPSQLWEFLLAKKDGYSKFPADRIKVESFYHPHSNRPGSFYTQGGCFLKSDVRQIDHTFFGIHPREVASLDPAQRKFLEVVYEAVESAGVTLDGIAGSKTGTFVGNFNYDHQLMQYRDAEYPQPYAVTGGGITVLSNRVNYVFDLKGPSMTLDTACSSSMYALHMACEAIHSGDCVGAIVGGSNLILTPECQVFSSALGAVSKTSRCHTFDIEADGYARADGIGALYIKKLSEAIKDRDPIRAVIRATAVNANGKTGGITHPSPDGQEAVIRRAYERAGDLDPSETTYFECHGTGTAVGDPIETEALGRVFANGRTSEQPLHIGSIKTNLGHSEPSSGISGIMKAVLALESGIIPPTIGLKTLNPNVNLWDGRLHIVTETLEWPDHCPVRRASVNSFGYGGANAHTILESVDSIVPGYRSSNQASLTKAKTLPCQSAETYLLPFSAHDERTLRKNVEALSHLDIPGGALADVAYTLSSRRSTMAYRTFAVASSDSVQADLSYATGSPVCKSSAAAPRIGFVFTGQGAQWPQMAFSLLKHNAIFSRCISELDDYLRATDSAREWTLRGVLEAEPANSIINEAEISQPIVTAVQIGVVELLQAWNVLPCAVSGHSSGEIAAAYSAGLTTKREAIVAAYLRGKAVAKNQQNGLMLAVGIGATEAEALTSPAGTQVTIACHNSPKSCTLSGDPPAIAAIKTTLDERGIFARELKTGHNAYHSHHMRALGQSYEQAMQDAFDGFGKDKRHDSAQHSPRRAVTDTQPAFFSSVYGSKISVDSIGPKYWRQNLESPVLFCQAATDMLEEEDVQVLVEIGPHSALQGPLRQIIEAANMTGKVEYLASITRNEDNVRNMLTLAGCLFARGIPIDLGSVNADDKATSKTVVDLPHYSWQYDGAPILTENRWTKEWRLREHPRHDILGSRIPGGVKQDPTWRNVLRIQDVPWLTQHCIGSDSVVPSAGFIAMAFEAATQIVEISGVAADQITSLEIQDLTLSRALIVSDELPVETLFNMRPVALNRSEHSKSRYEFYLVSVQESEGKSVFAEHCRGFVEINLETAHASRNEIITQFDGLEALHKQVNVAQWYERFSQIALNYGPSFQGILRLWDVGSTNISGAQIHDVPPVNPMSHESRYLIHPATLDAALQLSMVAANQSKVHLMKKTFMPTKVESMIIRPQEALSKELKNLVARGTYHGVRGLAADIALRGRGSSAYLEASNVFFIASDQHVEIPQTDHSPYTRMVWKPQFSDLTDETVTTLFPPLGLSADAVIPSLNTLALHQLIDFRINNDAVFQQGSEVPHLNRLLQWTESKLASARAQSGSLAQKIFDASQEWRSREIAQRAEALNARSSESRLMCHLYKNLPEIYAGEKTGIQVALQDNLLIDNYEHGQVYREGNKRLGCIIDLLAHERPGLKILEIGAGTGSATREVLKALNGDSAWRKYSNYHFTDTTPSFLANAETAFAEYHGVTYGTFDMELDAESQNYASEWDLVVASNVIHATSDIQKTLTNIRSVLKPGGRMILLELTQSQLSAGLVLGTFSDFWKGDDDPGFPRYDGPFLSKDMWRSVLPKAGFKGLDFHLDDYKGDNLSTTVICATVADAIREPEALIARKTNEGDILLVYRGTQSSLVEATGKCFSMLGHTVHRLPVEKCGIDSAVEHRRVVFMLEIERPFFVNSTTEEWQGFRNAAISARSILWVSAGSLLEGKEPAFAMISGIVRGLRTEMSHLRFCTLDVTETSGKGLPSLICEYEQRAYNAQPGQDMEFRRKDDVTYISRLIEDTALNKQSRNLHEKSLATEDVSLMELASTPIRLDIEKPGVLSTLFFREDHDLLGPLGEDQVDIKVMAAGINNKDIAVVTGQHHSDSMSDECAGKIIRVGAGVTDLQPGDLVQCLSFARMGNFVRERAAFCSRIHTADSEHQAATLPIAFGTAIYGLMELGRLQPGETVLIQSATGAVGLAAIQIALHCGAEIFLTVGTKEKRHGIQKIFPNIPEDHIFWSRERSSPRQLMAATGGRGVDVILCSARGQLMHDYWKCIASSGRFVEIGRTEVLQGGDLCLEVFRRNATFTSFDLEVLSKTKPWAIGKLMKTIEELRLSGVITPLPCQTYHVSQIDVALATFAKAVHIGKLVLTYEEDEAQPIKFRRGSSRTTFDPRATYLLVGCLGGLGRSFSRWAVQRGARSLLYLSRSGAHGPEASRFLDSLRLQGVHVDVALGDVANYADVEAAVRRSRFPIKGVVQGALTLNDGLFESMTLEQFNATLRARVDGTLNLHKALLNQPLAFFQMWSSWTLMFGTATQSNYLASNAFMDAFAQHRRSLGLPATSLALSQVLGVGIVSYMPEYQQAMIRNGFYGNNEEEFLAYCEAGIATDSPSWHTELSDTKQAAHDSASAGHLLVGIEPSGLVIVDRSYPLREMVWASDPRFSLLLHATDLLKSAAASAKRGMGGGAEDDWSARPVDEQIRVKMARLLYVAADEIAADKPIHAYGIDSMVAAELRNWLFAQFHKEVSMLSLLSAAMTVEKLAQTVMGAGEDTAA